MTHQQQLVCQHSLSSLLPEPCCARFPELPEQRGGRTFLLNPSVEVLRSLPEHHKPIIAYDILPSPDAYPFLRERTVWVPSHAFRHHFQLRQISADVRYPVPRAVPFLIQRKKKMKQHLGALGQKLLWIDDRLIPHAEKTALLDTLRLICRLSPQLKVMWVTDRKETKHQHIRFVPPSKADHLALWQGADLTLTMGSAECSFATFHVQCLHAGIVVLTDDQGDHGEWIRHQYTGLVLNPKFLNKELRHYLPMLVNNPDWLFGLKKNGQSLVHKTLKTSEATDNE
ncbi:hypothetical protein [Laceyella tengchongensis]